jgi:hypothetical protein
MDRKWSQEDSGNGPFTSSSSRRPLVEYCTNEWARDEKIPLSTVPSLAIFDEGDQWYDKYLDYLDNFYDSCHVIVTAPKFRRLALALVSTILIGWTAWTYFLGPFLEEERAALETFNTYNANVSSMLYGTNARPHLAGLIQTKDLDSTLLPGGPEAGKARRLVFIGDIHGCKHELQVLLEKVKFDDAQDHLVSVGDIVTKGPDPLGVIDLLREKKASVVRGNQDDRVILLAERHQRHARGEDVEDATAHSKHRHDLRAPEGIARVLSHAQLKWMQSFPLILRIGSFKKVGEVVVIHGGLVPGLPLAAQDPVSVMNMRSIDLETHVPSKQHHHKHPGSKPWFKIWDKYQRLLPAMNRWTSGKKPKHGLVTTQMTAIYGHNARMGLQISRYSKGLDTNCVRAGSLTALVLDERGQQEIVQISCSKDYTSSLDNDE